MVKPDFQTGCFASTLSNEKMGGRKAKEVLTRGPFQTVRLLGIQKTFSGLEESLVYGDPTHATEMQSRGCCRPGMQMTICRNPLARGEDGVQKQVGFTLHASRAGCQKAMPSGHHPNTLSLSPRATQCHHA